MRPPPAPALRPARPCGRGSASEGVDCSPTSVCPPALSLVRRGRPRPPALSGTANTLAASWPSAGLPPSRVFAPKARGWETAGSQPWTKSPWERARRGGGLVGREGGGGLRAGPGLWAAFGCGMGTGFVPACTRRCRTGARGMTSGGESIAKVTGNAQIHHREPKP